MKKQREECLTTVRKRFTVTTFLQITNNTFFKKMIYTLLDYKMQKAEYNVLLNPASSAAESTFTCPLA